MSDKARLNMRIDPVLKEWAATYAEDNNTTMSALVEKFFRALRRSERENLQARFAGEFFGEQHEDQ